MFLYSMHSAAWMVLTVEHEDEVLVPISTESGPWPVTSAGCDAKPWEYTQVCADGPWIRARQRATESALLCYRGSRWACGDKLLCSTTAAANRWAVGKKATADCTGGKGKGAWTHSVPHYRVLTPAEGKDTLGLLPGSGQKPNFFPPSLLSAFSVNLIIGLFP